MTTLTATALWKYADRYARRHEKAGQGTRNPTVRQAAKRFRVPQERIRDCVEGGDLPAHAEYLGIAVALGVPGAGYADLDGGDQLVEAY